MKTKLLCVLLAMMFALAMFAACDSGDSGDSGDNGTTQTPGGNTNPGGNTGGSNKPTYNANWKTTEILFALTDNNAAGELESGCQKYYAGTEGNAFEYIDDLVRERNLAAAKAANVNPRYEYKSANGGWGQNISTITDQVLANNSQNPDIYCNFVYDMTCAQLRNCFANLLEAETQSNFFKFVTDPDYVANLEANRTQYFDSSVGEGYYYEYMKSLTLSDDKMYCLASDYCTDLVRAFLVVPLNVEMMTAIDPADSFTGDMTSVSDFYDLVWKTEEKVNENALYGEGWTYKVLAHYAEKVYADLNDKDSDSKLADRIAFAAGATSGLVSSGFLYTSSVTIIDKQPNGDGTYKYSYAETNPGLEAFAKAITDLFTNYNGIVAVKNNDSEVGDFRNSGETELIAIRNRFAENKILFGGIIAVGSLENDAYQNMRTTGEKMGFGVLPVPTYRTGDEYLTLVHNIAKVIAISKATTEFAQCTAFLDYQSRTSADILNEYYDVRLASSAGGLAGKYNTHMLTYIRNHVRDCFDKTFEDAVANKVAATDSTATDTKWHEIIGGKYFQYPSFYSEYQANAKNKEAQLAKILSDWNNADQ